MSVARMSGVRSTEWAFELFRPVLKDLHLQSLAPKTCVLTSKKKYDFATLNMNRCVIVAMRYKFANPNDKGVFVWAFNKAHGFYVLYIILNDNLYADGMGQDDCVKRKLVTTHEFTHCTAAMLSLSKIKSEQLIRSLQESMSKNVDVIQSVDVDGVMNEFSKEMSAGISKVELSLRKFDDEHFRTNYEDFEGSYYDLNTSFLFSKQLFEEYFNEISRQAFNEHIKREEFAEAVSIISRATEQVIKEKSLDRKFVLARIQNDFMPAYLKEAAGFIMSHESQ